MRVTGHSTYHRYPFEAFVAAQDKLDIRVGPNRFRRDVISLDISSPGRTLQGELRFEGGHPWPVTLASPGSWAGTRWSHSWSVTTGC